MANVDTGKIALMFLTMGDHAQPEIWKEFLSGHAHQFNVYCHPYLPTGSDSNQPDGVDLIAQTSFLYDQVIPNRAHTEWGYLTNAYYALLAEAIKDTDNQRFVYLSDTCVPVQRPDEVHSALKQCLDTTFMDAPTPRQDLQRYRKRLGIERRYFFKHAGWFTLCLADALKLARSEKWFNTLNTIKAGDEHILSILKKSKTSTLLHRPTTYVRWDLHRHDLYRSGKLQRAYRAERNPLEKKQLQLEIEKCQQAARHPIAWDTRITSENLREFLHADCLFVRKILPGCDVQVLLDSQELGEPSLI